MLSPNKRLKLSTGKEIEKEGEEGMEKNNGWL